MAWYLLSEYGIDRTVYRKQEAGPLPERFRGIAWVIAWELQVDFPFAASFQTSGDQGLEEMLVDTVEGDGQGVRDEHGNRRSYIVLL